MKNVVETSALPVVVRAERFPVAAVRKVEANARVSGRLDGASARGKFSGHVALDRVDVYVPLVGKKPIHSAGGQIDIAGDVATGKVDVTRIDVAFATEAEALAATAGATVDRAIVALRVRGSSRQLALTGDVDVVSAHVKANALKSGGSKGGGAGGGSSKSPLAGHPEIEAMGLDVKRPLARRRHPRRRQQPARPAARRRHARRRDGKKPSISGSPAAAPTCWTSFVLALAKLFS